MNWLFFQTLQLYSTKQAAALVISLALLQPQRSSTSVGLWGAPVSAVAAARHYEQFTPHNAISMLSSSATRIGILPNA